MHSLLVPAKCCHVCVSTAVCLQEKALVVLLRLVQHPCPPGGEALQYLLESNICVLNAFIEGPLDFFVFEARPFLGELGSGSGKARGSLFALWCSWWAKAPPVRPKFESVRHKKHIA